MITPIGDRRYAVDLPPEIRTYVAEALDGLRARLMTGADDPALRRLFPTAYNDDAALDEEYQRLMRSELLASRLTALDAVEQSIHATTVTADDLEHWMQSVNALRLVLGTALDVPEEPMDLAPDDPRFDDYVLYDVLGQLLMLIIQALYGGEVPKRRRFWRR